MRSLYAKMLELIDEGRPFAVATVLEARGSVPGKPGAKMIVLDDGRSFGTVGGAGLEERVKELSRSCLADGRRGIFPFDLHRGRDGALDSICGGSVKIGIELVETVPRLLVVGGGHCGLELARLCDQLGYDYTVVDDRAEYASRDRFPNARRVIHASPDTLGYQVDLAGFSHAILVGWSWRNDLETLATLVDRFPGWIGIIASRTKRKEMFARLRERGVTETRLERIVAPVGLPIGAVTPAEIAVSILGQVIATVRRQ